ncbi:DNA-packaging protein gp3 [Ancylomarina subtilis]|uniref:DNA-packaging protein gp3 n=1 Tax=Ancylomarina subtilis TaxID=1639035 RepID=A0A4Q7VK80_9BACT|nr:terminase small subunit [Ancylomarina subtilis]RZT96613.1 DNA-packaging protein gp3 [Ancylomarina subtilis]
MTTTKNKGNSNALGNFTGRPPKFANAKKLLKKINEYFEHCHETNKRPLIIGLALYCGFASRESFYQMKHRDNDFARVIEYGRSMVSATYEEYLLDKASGAKFALVNLDKWSDKTEQEVTQTNVVLTMKPSFDFEEESEAEE